MQNCVVSGDKGTREFDFFAGIEIAIKAGRVAAGNSRRREWPLRRRLFVAQRSREIRNLPGFIRVARSGITIAMRNTSVRSCANPSGATSTSLAVKSVSTAGISRKVWRWPGQ